MPPSCETKYEPNFTVGPKCLEISMKLHKINRDKLCAMLENSWNDIPKDSTPTTSLIGVYIVLQGGSAISHGGSDCDQVFRQESFFHWTFGGLEPDWYGAIDVCTKKAVLFIPSRSQSSAIYEGELPSLSQLAQRYGVEEFHYINGMSQYFLEHGAVLLLTMYGLNTDSGQFTHETKFDGIEKFKVDNILLHKQLVECRLTKSPMELEVMRYAAKISSGAHKHLMRTVKPGMSQFQAESIFKHYCYFYGGMRHVAYTCIAASGCDCAILHYGHAGRPNDGVISDGDMCLFDMGGEYYCYTSDITCSWPVNGRFSPHQRTIYEAVLAAVRAVLQVLRAGVNWTEMHQLAERTILQHLKEAGLVQGAVSEMMQHNLAAIFMPHGLGHLIGCDTHDVGGYTEDTPHRSSKPGLRNLRTARSLLPNMVITVEPGCYFIDSLLSVAAESPILSLFLVPKVIEEYKIVGGVRIEEDVLITETGCEVLSDVPRTPDEIEAWMSLQHTDYDEIK